MSLHQPQSHIHTNDMMKKGLLPTPVHWKTAWHLLFLIPLPPQITTSYEIPPLYGLSCFLLFNRIPHVFKADWLYIGHALLFHFLFVFFFYFFYFIDVHKWMNELIHEMISNSWLRLSGHGTLTGLTWGGLCGEKEDGGGEEEESRC